MIDSQPKQLYTGYMSEPKKEKAITTRYPLDVYQSISDLAEKHDRSFNGEVIHALRRHIEQCNIDIAVGDLMLQVKKSGPTPELEAIAEYVKNFVSTYQRMVAESPEPYQIKQKEVNEDK